MMAFDEALQKLPLIAILRGLHPDSAVAVGDALVEAGFTLIEVPLNSPEPMESIARLSRQFAGRAVIGAGTVIRAQDVDEITAAGGQFIVMPHSDAAVIQATKRHHLASCPGVMTPGEAFTALQNGADILKFFPAEVIPPKMIAALRQVLPATAKMVPVGGINPDSMADYLNAGADGFGLGSALFKPDRPVHEIHTRAVTFVERLRLSRALT